MRVYGIRKCANAKASDGARARNVWDHRIPKSAYDHSDPEDVRRCWSKPNMHPMHSTANKEKLTTLLPEEVAKVPQELWPKAWEGVARTA